MTGTDVRNWLPADVRIACFFLIFCHPIWIRVHSQALIVEDGPSASLFGVSVTTHTVDWLVSGPLVDREKRMLSGSGSVEKWDSQNWEAVSRRIIVGGRYRASQQVIAYGCTKLRVLSVLKVLTLAHPREKPSVFYDMDISVLREVYYHNAWQISKEIMQISVTERSRTWSILLFWIVEHFLPICSFRIPRTVLELGPIQCSAGSLYIFVSVGNNAGVPCWPYAAGSIKPFCRLVSDSFM
jgi:hypothetical protein